MVREELDRITLAVIQASIEVHRHLGPGLLEGLYRECLLFELRARGSKVIADELIPISYKGQPLKGYYRIDLLVEDTVIVELKSVETLLPVHGAQVLSYLRLIGKPVGLLINFNVSYLAKGVRRIVTTFEPTRRPGVPALEYESTAPSMLQFSTAESAETLGKTAMLYFHL